MPELRDDSTSDLQARIRNLEHRRSDLWSVAGGAKTASNVYLAFIEGRRAPSDASQAHAATEGYDLMERYRNLMAEKLAIGLIARIRAKCITETLRDIKASGRTDGRATRPLFAD